MVVLQKQTQRIEKIECTVILGNVRSQLLDYLLMISLCVKTLTPPYLSILCHVVVHGVVGPLTMGRQQYHHFPVVFGLIWQGWRAWTDRGH